MSAGVIILCRFNSKRLPGKIMLPIGGQPMLSVIACRVRRSGLPMVVATSDQATDDPIATLCEQTGLSVYRGALDNVAGRFLDCAQSQGWDYAVRINGDNLFVDAELLSVMTADAVGEELDFVTNVPGRTYPPGTSIECVRTTFYAEQYPHFGVADREHVTSFLYEHEELGRRRTHVNPRESEMRGLHLAIDTRADYDRAAAVVGRLGTNPCDIGLQQVIRVLNA